MEGAEFALACDVKSEGPFESRGLENGPAVAKWSRNTMQRFNTLADRLRLGQLSQIECGGTLCNAGLATHGGNILCMGWRHDLTLAEVRKKTLKALLQWAS